MKSIMRSLYGRLQTSLRLKVTLGVVLPLILILGTFTTIEYIRHRRVVLDNLALLGSHAGQVVEENLRHLMLVSDFSGVQELLDSISDRDRFRIVNILDPSGRVIFAPQGLGVGSRLDNASPDCQPCHSLPPGERPKSVVVTADDGQRVFRSMQTIENSPACARCHDPAQRLIGLLLTDISMTPMEEALASGLRENLLWWAGTILVTMIIVYLAMSQMVIQRLEGLARSLNQFGRGSLHLRLPHGNSDEIGQLATAFNKMGKRIESEAEGNRILTEHLHRQSTQRGELLKRLITAQEDERKRVARELHDQLGQAMGVLSLQTEAMEHLIDSDPERASQQLALTRSLISEATDRMYDLILDLRPSVLDDLGLIAALRAHAERTLADSGIRFDLQASGMSERLPAEMETALYRVYQEALSNVLRHAKAEEVRMQLTCHNGMFECEIADDGCGFELAEVEMNHDHPRGLGLLGMQERLEQCGGHLEIFSQPGGGTRIIISIPLREVDCG